MTQPIELTLQTKLSLKARIRIVIQVWHFFTNYDQRKNITNLDAIITLLNNLKFKVVDVVFKA